jgi:nitrile hydratase beta subunit
MNSGHDFGGMMGFGPVDTKHQNINFHEKWEERIFALTLAMGGTGSWNIDTSRHARENMHPGLYTTLSYYQIWLAGLEKLLLSAGLISASELAEGHQHSPAKPVASILNNDKVMDVLLAGSSYEREPLAPNKFNTGNTVSTRNMHPAGHTRIPRYARGKTGIIERVHGCHVFPDSNAHGDSENQQWLYKVRFTAREIWGEDHSPNDTIFVDLWEPYFAQ